MATPRETLLCRYSYDALDRLTSNELPNEPEHQRFYCKSRLATEIQGANRYSVFQHGDQLLAQQHHEGGSPGTTLLATDQQRSVLQTLKINQPQRAIAYTPYGHHPAGSGLLSLLGFNGERRDRVTGWYLLGGYRAFNPFLMRFISPDSLSPFGKGGLNSYVYCLGDPLNRRDSNGHVSFRTVTRAIIFGLRLQADQVAKTNTILLRTGRFSLKPGISPTKAVSARAKYDKLVEMLSEAKFQNEKFSYDLAQARKYAPELENMTGITKSSNDRLKLLEYIETTPTPNNKNRLFDMEKLSKAGESEYDLSIPPHKLPSPELADRYYQEITQVRHPYFAELTSEAIRIRDLHFNYIK